MDITTTELHGYTMIHLNFERLDIVNMQETKEQLHSIILEKNHIVLDMQKVTFVDSSGLSVLIGTLKQVTAKESGSLKLCGLTNQPIELLELTQLHSVFTIVEDCNTL
jgi:anti-anti-sigma factor